MSELRSADVRDALRDFICAELMQRPDYPLDDAEPLITGGLIDSFSLAHVGVFIEARFGVYIPDPELTVENMDTLQQIVRRILATPTEVCPSGGTR
jgi:acyl carrier protein